jgi:hypothetical protein
MKSKSNHVPKYDLISKSNHHLESDLKSKANQIKIIIFVQLNFFLIFSFWYTCTKQMPNHSRAEEFMSRKKVYTEKCKNCIKKRSKIKRFDFQSYKKLKITNQITNLKTISNIIKSRKSDFKSSNQIF